MGKLYIQEISMLIKIFRMFVFFVLIIFALCGCVSKNQAPDLYQSIVKRDKLIVGTSFDSKPFSFKDKDGRMRGVEPDLAREIAARLLGNPNKVQFVDVVPRYRIQTVMSGDVDMIISTMTINFKRKRFVNFSTPYYEASQVICVKKDRKIDEPEDLLNKKVMVILGTTGEDNIRSFAPNALIWSFEDSAEAINAFKNTSADAVTTDDSLLLGLAMENNNYFILPIRLTKEPYGIAYRKSSSTKVFGDKLNEIIKDIISDGTLDTIKEKWGVY